MSDPPPPSTTGESLPSADEKGTYPLTVAWIVGDIDAGIILGQLSYGTRELQMNVWKAVPLASGNTPFYLEIRDQRHAFEQAKAISAETVKGLLGEPADILLARKRQTAGGHGIR